MACVIPLRLAVALRATQTDVAVAAAEAERARLDLVTIEGSVDDVRAALAATSRLGVLADRAGPSGEDLESLAPGRAGVLDGGSPGVSLVGVTVHDDATVAGQIADLAFVRPASAEDTAALVARVREARNAAGREHDPLLVFADLTVVLDTDEDAAHERAAALGARGLDTQGTGIAVWAGSPARLAPVLMSWRRAGLDGFRLFAAAPEDLARITSGLVPALREHDAFRFAYEARDARGILGLPAKPAREGAAA